MPKVSDSLWEDRFKSQKAHMIPAYTYNDKKDPFGQAFDKTYKLLPDSLQRWLKSMLAFGAGEHAPPKKAPKKLSFVVLGL